MKKIYILLTMILMPVIPALAAETPDANDVIVKMTSVLNLQQDQITNITPIIQKYTIAFTDLQKSVADGTINPSAIASQREGIKEEETQELSQYLRPDQLSEWITLQSQIYQKKDPQSSEDADADADPDADKYSNLPTR